VGKFSEIIYIQIKSFIYKIPVIAMIMPSDEYDKLNSEKIIKYGQRLPFNAEIYKKEVCLDYLY